MKVLCLMKDRKRSFPFQFVQLYVHFIYVCNGNETKKNITNSETKSLCEIAKIKSILKYRYILSRNT